MKSSRPKVLHQLAGKPLLQHVVDTSRNLEPEQIIVVIGHGAEQVKNTMQGQDLVFVVQQEQRGTGHALQQSLDQLNPGNDVLVLFGDVPLVRTETMAQMTEPDDGAAICILSFEPDNPFGYGRVIRNGEGVTAIVEQKDTTVEQAALNECYSGIMLIRGNRVHDLAALLDNNNAQNEFYLTDLVKHAVSAGDLITAIVCDEPSEVSGVNNQQQLAAVEALYRMRRADDLMNQGAKLSDPARVDVRGNLNVGQDVEIDVNCIFEGNVSLGNNVKINANCVIRNSTIGDGSQILPMCVIEDSQVGNNASIGPFARLRPNTVCDDNTRIGNFVETKKSRIGQGSKVSHLSYIGDTEMGSGVNVGAGTITCNYDGANKHQTTIEDGVFIGSNTQLVAPVKLEQNATIGAGSTITKDAPAEKLTLTRAKQITMDNWTRPKKRDD